MVQVKRIFIEQSSYFYIHTSCVVSVMLSRISLQAIQIENK